MRKKMAIVLTILLGVSLFSGCQSTSVDGDGQENQGLSGNEIAAPDIEDTIFAERIPWKENENLYEIPLDLLDGVAQSELYRVGNDLLLTYTQYDIEAKQSFYYMKLIDIETGQVKASSKSTGPTYGKVQMLEDGIGILDFGEGSCWILDESLQMQEPYEIFTDAFCMNKTGDGVYVFSYGEGIQAVDFASGQEQVLLDHAAGVYFSDISNDAATFSYVDTQTLLQGNGILDLASGQMQILESEYAYGALEATGGIWLGSVENADALYVVGSDAGQWQFEAELGTNVDLNENSGQILMAENTENAELYMAAYDVDGSFVSRCESTDLRNSFYNDFAWYEEYGAYVFTMTDSSGTEHLFFWDVTAETNGEDLALTAVSDVFEYPEGTAVAQEYYDRAKELSEKYDMEILIADQCDTEFSDHTADLLLDEAAITQALDTLDYALGRYPEGFFTQLKHSSYREIEIQIVGMLRKDSSEGDVSYISGGFVSTAYSDHLLMTLDSREVVSDDGINSIMEETIYHEFSHIIDKRLEYDSMFRADAVYSEEGWLALNPDDFEYNDTYYGTLDSRYADYFVDAYACSYPTEDRARTMEYAMYGEVGTFAGKEGLTDKLEYYCESIRDSFDTAGWPDETPWEATLNQVR